jgi:peptidoglycan/LPS O-acetylase OafA/YrhL
VSTIRRLDSVHGLRGLAAVAVVLFHLSAIPSLPPPTWAADVIRHFYLSVHFFFVLSAFALSHAMASSRQTYGGYLAKRFFRIAPLFYILVAWNINRAGFPGLTTVLSNISFSFNLFPGRAQSLVWAGWSVGVEMLFYLFFPLVFIASEKPVRAIAAFALGVVASTVLWTFWQHDPKYSSYVYLFVGSNLTDFFAGVCAYRLFMWAGPHSRRRPIGVSGLGTAVLLLVFMYYDPLSLHERRAGLYFAAWSLPFALLCFSQALCPIRAIGSPSLRWLGDRSFSIYLLHPVVIELSRPLYKDAISTWSVPPDWQYVFCAAMTFPVLLVASDISYRLVEAPGMRIGRHLA